MTIEIDDVALPPVGALLRRPAVLVRHEVMASLHQAGFDDVLPAHLGVFQHPGPDGQRPGVLALRTSASKQAMNHLLHQLESGGYLVREAHPDDRRTRVVRLTERGWAAVGVIRQTMVRLEHEWARALGARRTPAWPAPWSGSRRSSTRPWAPAAERNAAATPRVGALGSGHAHDTSSWQAALTGAPRGQDDAATPRS